MTDILTDADFAAVMAPLGPFETSPVLAVAVSGGVDSLCLAVLADRWAGQRNGRVVALTVDHGLRPDSAAEAARVADGLSVLGIEHHILRWTGAKPAADIQAAARAARYALLERWCAGRGILHLLLAHHRDDQAETVLLRLGRGSGVDGLSAMAAVSERFALRLLRPLLAVPRDRLVATVAARGLDWVEDPSNRNSSFARVRWRSMLPELAAEGLSAQRLAATARRLGRAADALDAAAGQLAARCLDLHPAGFALVDAAAVAVAEDDIGLRLLARVTRALGGGTHPPREDRVLALHHRLRHDGPVAATLAGCRLLPWRGRLLICREAGRMAPPVAVAPGAETAWDGRFRLAARPDAPSGLTVGGLGGTGRCGLGAAAARRLSALPGPVRPTLPALYDQQGLCAVPHLGYNRDGPEGAMVRWIVAAPAVPVTSGGRRLV